jgi:hypothetical protein
LKLAGQRSFDRDPLAGFRARETDAPGMQEEALEVRGGRRSAVQLIAVHRMPDARQMHADLVGAASANTHFQIRESGPAPQNFVVGYGGAPGRIPSRHARAVDIVARDRGGDAAGIGRDRAVDEGQINFFGRAGGELSGQVAMSGVGFGHQQHAAGFAIQPVDDAGTQFSAQLREILKAMNQPVYQRSFPASRACMHDESRGLVDGHQIVILIEDIDGQVFGFRGERLELQRIDQDLFRTEQRKRRLRFQPAVDSNTPLPDPVLKPRPAIGRKVLLQIMIEPFAGVG